MAARVGDVIPLTKLRKSIPARLFQPSLLKSLVFVVWDVAIVTALWRFILAVEQLPAAWWWALWPCYVVAQGIMFWALFVLGHDCGHGSFSRSSTVNGIVGHALHSFLLVPYHSWRISHTHGHHKNTGNIDKDEIFYPFRAARMQRKKWRLNLYPLLPVLLAIAWPGYLLMGYEGKGWRASHFNPRSSLFRAPERPLVALSVAVWAAVMATLCAAGALFGWTRLLAYYTAPYFVFAACLVVVTFLHHNDDGVVWYADREWTYVKGNLSTVDRTYGWLESIHHNIGTHTVHHLFPQIPHYNLVEADRFLKSSPVAPAIHSSAHASLRAFLTAWTSYLRTLVVPDDAAMVVLRGVPASSPPH